MKKYTKEELKRMSAKRLWELQDKAEANKDFELSYLIDDILYNWFK